MELWPTVMQHKTHRRVGFVRKIHHMKWEKPDTEGDCGGPFCAKMHVQHMPRLGVGTGNFFPRLVFIRDTHKYTIPHRLPMSQPSFEYLTKLCTKPITGITSTWKNLQIQPSSKSFHFLRNIFSDWIQRGCPPWNLVRNQVRLSYRKTFWFRGLSGSSNFKGICCFFLPRGFLSRSHEC